MNTECYHLVVHFVTIVTLHMSTTPVFFTGCVQGVKVECPECGSGVKAVATIGTISALFKVVEKYSVKVVLNPVFLRSTNLEIYADRIFVFLIC